MQGLKQIFRRFRGEQRGVTFIEMAISITLLLVLALGFVDFGYAFYQWNSAVKAVEAGARMASISDPVVAEIRNAGSFSVAGDPVAVGDFDYVCDGNTGNCTCTGGGCVSASATMEQASIDRILCGDDACPGSGGECRLVAGSRPGMCDFFPRIEQENVVIRYTASGLGYQGRPGGAVPTITVSLQNLTFEFFFLGDLLGFGNITMPSMLSTVTGEDMASTFL